MPLLPHMPFGPQDGRAHEPGAEATLGRITNQSDDPPVNQHTIPAFSIRFGLMLAATYVVLGKLGLMLAIPPGYASGVFPPAGLAIAAAYLWGGATLPWIILGSLTLNLSVAATPLETSAIVAALCIAMASTIQSWVGRGLLNRTIGRRTGLDTIEHIGGYLLTAPFICIIGASLSVASLVLVGVIPPHEAFMAWMTWGIGDTLGMVSVFPIMVALFGTPDSAWEGRRVLVTSVMSITFVLVLLAYLAFCRIESAEMVQAFHFQADRFANKVQDHFDEQSYLLDQLDQSLSISRHESINRDTFRTLVQPSLRRFHMLQAIEWAPEISSSRRAAFEATQKTSHAGFEIRERDKSGLAVSAASRPTYYPITYVEPLIRNEKVVGFDLGSHRARRMAVLQAMNSDQAIATEPVTLIQESGSQLGILLLKRVQTGANAPGLILTVLRVGDFIEKLRPEGAEMAVQLTDVELGSIVYGEPSIQTPVADLTRVLRFGGRHYLLQLMPLPGSIVAHHGLQGWGLLVGGIFADGLLGAILLLITGTTNHVRSQVEEQTQQLAIKSDLLKTVIDTVPVRVFWKDRALRYLGCNPAFARDAGKSSPSELLGKTDYDLAWANEAGQYQADDVRVIECESPKIAFVESQTTPSGKTNWLRTSKVPLKDRTNQVIGVLGIYEDISEQRATETRLRESEERFTWAMQAASDGLWDWNIQNQVTYFSPQWKAMLGYADHELDNSFSTWERLVDEEGRISTMALIQDCLSGKSNGFKTEFRMRHKDGHWVDILSRGTIIQDQNGKPLRMVGTHVDMTERNDIARQLEQAARTMEQQNKALAAAHTQALAATEAKSAFLASISHEIRTPLNAIVGMADLLQETSLSQDQADYVQRFSQAADHLMCLVNNVLDLSKIEAGELQLEQIPFNLHELVTTVGTLMAVTAETKQLTLDVRIHPAVPTTVTGDPVRLRQVLMNLVGNAIKFTEHGQVVVTADAIAPDRMQFTVSDTGIGIPSDKLPFIFESFTQADTTTTRKFGGTGLGLSICQQLVSMMEGRLNVTSTAGVGSTFEFVVRLPNTIESMSPVSDSHVQQQTESLSGPSARPLSILVVDDLEDNRVIVAHYLKNSAYVIETAENGQIAIAKFQTGRYDLVLMDVQMPVMDGLQATSAIRQWERAHHRPPTPILALTAHALREEEEKSLDAGCTAHLTKPIRKQTLVRAIREYILPQAAHPVSNLSRDSDSSTSLTDGFLRSQQL